MQESDLVSSLPKFSLSEVRGEVQSKSKIEEYIFVLYFVVFESVQFSPFMEIDCFNWTALLPVITC